MDVMDDVRRLGTDAGPLSESQRDSARALLAEEMSSAGHRPAGTRWRWGAGPAVVAGAVVVVLLLPWAPPDTVPASASEVLRGAAEVTVTGLDADLEPGQYLRIETRSEGVNLWRADRAVMDSSGGGWDIYQNASCTSESKEPDLVLVPPEPEAALLHRSVAVLYVPADRAGEWVAEYGRSAVITTYGPRRDEAVELWPDDSSAPRFGEVMRYPGGRSGPPEDLDATFVDSFRPYYDEMPRDHEKLVDWFNSYRAIAAGPGAERSVVFDIVHSLSSLLAPPDLRAAMWEALASLDAVELVSIDGDIATLHYDSRSYPCPGATTFEVDTARGYVVSLVHDAGTIMPDFVPDTVVSRTTFDISVVDTAP